MVMSVAEGAFGQLGLQGKRALRRIGLSSHKPRKNLHLDSILSTEFNRLGFEAIGGSHKNHGLAFKRL